MRPVAFAALVAASLVGTASAQAPSADRTFRWFKRAERLTLDPSTFVVLPAPGVPPDVVRLVLKRRGVPTASIGPFVVAPWLTASPPPEARSVARLESFLRALARERALAFVSPQWIDATGGAVTAAPGLVVAFRPGLPAEEAGRRLALARLGAILERDFCGVPGAWRLRPDAKCGSDVLAAAERLAERDDVRFAEPDLFASGRPAHVPTDPDYPKSWALGAAASAAGRDVGLGCEQAWDVTRGDPSVGVLILDNGVEGGHPDLTVAAGVDATGGRLGSDGEPASVLDVHGTAVAGCVAAQMDNDHGACGVAPGCRLLSARVYRTVPRRAYVMDPVALARALAWGRSQGARVSNFSAYLSVPTALASAAYERAYELGMAHFAAAGNHRRADLPFPARLPFVSAVVALDASGDLAPFSNFGPGVAFAAPGVGVYATDLRGIAGYSTDDFAAVSGTSFAAPLAAGVAALAISADRSLGAADVEAILRRTATDLGDRGPDPTFGFGAVHAARAVRAAAEGEAVDAVVIRASVAASGLQGDAPSFDAAPSADGRWIAFASEAADLVPGDGARVADVFVRDVERGVVTRLSVGSAGVEGDGSSLEPSLSADGRFAAFASYATTFDRADRNGVRDVYVRDRDVDEDGVFDEPDATATRLVSRGLDGLAADGPSAAPTLSADGGTVVFESAASNLVADGRAGVVAVYAARRTAHGFGRPVRISSRPDGGPADGDSRRASVSADGAVVAFESRATDLVPGGGGRVDVYVARLSPDGDGVAALRRVSERRDGRPADGESRRPCVAADGSAVWFNTTATNLDEALRPPDVVRIARATVDGAIYVVDPTAEEPAAAPSAAADVGAATAPDLRPRPALHERLAVDAAERALAFVGSSERAGGRGRDVFVLRVVDGALRSPTAPVAYGRGRASGVAFAANGRLVAFDSDAADLVRSDTNLRRDVFTAAVE